MVHEQRVHIKQVREAYKTARHLSASGSQPQSSMVKNANTCCFLLKTGKEASNLQSFFPILCQPEEWRQSWFTPCLVILAAWRPCPQASAYKKAGVSGTHCQQMLASLPAVARAGPLLQHARRGGDSPTPCAAFGPRALGRGLWARWSQGAAICGREWRLESRGYVLSI